MRSNKSLNKNEPQKMLKMSQRDFDQVAEWYKASKNNYFKWNQDQSLIKGEQFREVHLRVYFSQIYFTDLFVSTYIDLLRNLNQNTLSISGGILKSQDQQLQGKPYENKNIQAYFDMNNKSLVLRQQINLYTYTLESKKRDSLFFLEFSLTNSEGQTFRVGKLEFNMNSNLNQISELTINNKNKKKVAFIQAIIEKQPIKDFPRLVPPSIIIDQKTKIPAIKLIQMKNKRQPIVLETRSKMKILGMKILFQDKSKLMEKIQKNNPFLSSHHENVQITQIDYKLKFGTHNSWKFIDMKDENNVISLKETKSFEKNQNSQKQLLLVSNFNKGYLNKTYFECSSCVFVVLLNAQISYRYEGFADKKVENLGWCMVVNKIYQSSIKFESFLETHNSLPGYEMNIVYEGIKLSVQIDNPDHKCHRKKLQDDFPQQSEFNKIFFDEQTDQLTKTIFVKRQITERSALLTSMGTFKQLNQTQKQLHKLIEQVQQQMKKVKRKITVRGHFVSPQPKSIAQKQKDYQNLLKVENKQIRIGIKLISMIPVTDEISFRKGQYYLPLKFRTKIHMMRKTVQLQGQFVDNNASWNIPVFIKSGKETSFIERQIRGRQQFKKVMDSLMLLRVWDMQNDRFYGGGQLSVMQIFESFNKQGVRYEIELMDQSRKMSSLVIQLCISVRSGESSSTKKQVQAIQARSIIQSLPMKQRMMMRISNFNNSNSELENKAISYYKQKNMGNVIERITSNEVNNAAQIEYQLNQPSYHLLQFNNTSQSQNNIFTFLVKQCEFAEIITDQQEYKQIVNSYNMNAIPFNKIEFHHSQNQNNSNQTSSQYYTSKISHSQTVGLLIKIHLLEWSSKIKQQTNFSIQIQRNTIPVTTHKFKLLFKQPLIHSTISLYQINHNLSKGISLYLPTQIINKYHQLISFSKHLSIKNKPKLQLKLTVKQPLKSPHKIQFLIQGKVIVSEFQEKTQNILIELNLLDGQYLQVQLGQYSNKGFIINAKANPYLLNQILILPDSNITQSIKSEKTVFIISEQQIKVNLTICNFQSKLQNIVIKFFNFKYQIQYQYLLKIITKLKITPITFNVQNFIGQKIIIQCINPYVSPMKFYALSNTNSVRFDRQIVKIQPRSGEKIVFQLVDKLYQKSYVAIYDDELILTQIFQLEFIDQKAFKMYKILN